MFDINTHPNYWVSFINNSGIKVINPATGRCVREAPMNGYVTKMKLNETVKEATIIFNDENNNLVISSAEINIKKFKFLGKPTVFEKVNTIVFDSKKNVIFKDLYDVKQPLIRGALAGSNIDALNAVKTTFNSLNFMDNSGVVVNLTDIDDISNFLLFKEPIKKKTKTQKELDLLVKKTPEVKRVNYYFKEPNCNQIAMIDRIDFSEPCCCLRNFTYINNSMDVLESIRIYIFKDRIVSAKKNNIGDYVFSNISKIGKWDCPLADIKPEIGEGTKLAYFTSIANEVISIYRAKLLYYCLNYPVFESLYKSGYKSIASAILYNSIEIISLDENETNFYKCLGLNKHQLNKTNDYLNVFSQLVLQKPDGIHSAINRTPSEYSDLVRQARTTWTEFNNKIKDIYNKGNISDIDDETYDYLFQILTGPALMTNICLAYIRTYNIESFLDKKEFFTIWENYFRSVVTLGFYRQNYVAQMFIDTLNMIKDMNLSNSVRCTFENVEELTEAHDFLYTIYETNINKYKTQRFIEECEKLRKYTFAGSKFIVLVPEKPNDLAVEGMELHHCVKSYIDKVCRGETGIMFIRQKEEKDKPFFTVEVQNGTIVQVHGFGNCNVTEPSLKNFISKWAETRKLSINAAGYNIVR